MRQPAFRTVLSLFRDYHATEYDDSISDVMIREDIGERAAVRIVHAELQQSYEAIRDVFEGLNGDPIWRAISIDEDTDPAQLEEIGIYWAWASDAAEPYSGSDYNRPLRATFEAVADLRHVDLVESYATNMAYGMYEAEVRYKPDSPIFVQGCWVTDLDDDAPVRNRRAMMPIQDWRSTGGDY